MIFKKVIIFSFVLTWAVKAFGKCPTLTFLEKEFQIEGQPSCKILALQNENQFMILIGGTPYRFNIEACRKIRNQAKVRIFGTVADMPSELTVQLHSHYSEEAIAPLYFLYGHTVLFNQNLSLATLNQLSVYLTPQLLTPNNEHRSRTENFECEHCGITETPMKRKGPHGRDTLCNACGLKWKKTRDEIKSQNNRLPHQARKPDKMSIQFLLNQ